MKQVVQNLKTGRVAVEEIPAPTLRGPGVLVATHCSLISPGTERATVELGRSSLVGKALRRPDQVRKVLENLRREGLWQTYQKVQQRLDVTRALGYSCSGIVLEARGCDHVRPGDRVVAYLPNIPHTVVAFLACASLGALWSVCSPDMGPVAVLDRFRRWRAGGCVMGPKQLSAVQQQAMGHVQQALAVLNAGVKRLEVFVETRQAMTRGRVVRTALEGKWLAKAAKLIDDLDLVLMRLEEVTELNRAEDLLRDVMGRLVAKRWDKEQRAKLAEDFERRKAEAKAAWTAPIIDPAAEAAVAVKPSRWR